MTLVVLEDGVGKLRDAFNKDAGCTRLLILTSPT
jgi:hypothetical protein